MWGRNLHRNMQRFLTFQLTVNISICYATALGSIFGHPPLNVLQMLWANLCMDILAAIALGTEAWVDTKPKAEENAATPALQRSKTNAKQTQEFKDTDDAMSMRIARKDPLMRPFMWQQIFVQVAYQAFVMTILMLFGGLMLGFGEDKPNLVKTPLRDPDNDY